MVAQITKKRISCGFSLPPELMRSIDSERGDISRSRYVLRLIEKSLSVTQKRGSEDRNKESTESLKELSVS